MTGSVIALNTIAGSMRMTLHDGGERGNDAHHDGQQKQDPRSAPASSRPAAPTRRSTLTMIRPMTSRDAESDDRAQQRLSDDDVVRYTLEEPIARSVANSFKCSLVLE